MKAKNPLWCADNLILMRVQGEGRNGFGSWLTFHQIDAWLQISDEVCGNTLRMVSNLLPPLWVLRAMSHENVSQNRVFNTHSFWKCWFFNFYETFCLKELLLKLLPEITESRKLQWLTSWESLLNKNLLTFYMNNPNLFLKLSTFLMQFHILLTFQA